jgi:hypothetical protein
MDSDGRQLREQRLADRRQADSHRTNGQADEDRRGEHEDRER